MGRAQGQALFAIGLLSPAFSEAYYEFLREFRFPLIDLPPGQLELVDLGKRMLSDDLFYNLPHARLGHIDRERAASIAGRRPDIPWSLLFGRATRAQEAAYSRNVRKLEKRGLVTRVRRGNIARTTHVRITPTGVEALLQELRVALYEAIQAERATRAERGDSPPMARAGLAPGDLVSPRRAKVQP